MIIKISRQNTKDLEILPFSALFTNPFWEVFTDFGPFLSAILFYQPDQQSVFLSSPWFYDYLGDNTFFALGGGISGSIRVVVF